MESQERIVARELSRLFMEIGKKADDFEKGIAKLKTALERTRRAMEL